MLLVYKAGLWIVELLDTKRRSGVAYQEIYGGADMRRF